MSATKTFTTPNNEFSKTKEQWRAVYLERGKHGSERGLGKPTAERR
jgi:hypothetical protein